MEETFRPLSPHVLIYKPQFSSVLSVLNRITGVALTLGLVFMWLFLCCLFISPLRGHSITYQASCYFSYNISWTITGIFAILLISLLYHILNGIRYIFLLRPEQDETSKEKDSSAPYRMSRAAVAKSGFWVAAVASILYVLIVGAVYFIGLVHM